MYGIIVMSGSPFKVGTNIDNVLDVSVFDSLISLINR